MNQEEMLAEILDNTRKTKNYMKWQLIITVALVVLPILAVALIMPLVFNSLNSAYNLEGSSDLLQNLR